MGNGLNGARDGYVKALEKCCICVNLAFTLTESFRAFPNEASRKQDEIEISRRQVYSRGK